MFNKLFGVYLLKEAMIIKQFVLVTVLVQKLVNVDIYRFIIFKVLT